MLGLDMYGSGSEEDDEDVGESPLPLGAGIGGSEHSSHDGEAGGEAPPQEEAVPAVPHSVQVREALDFSQYEHDMLRGFVGEEVAVAPQQAEVFQMLHDNDRHPTQFIMNHHDFMNPERTNSKLGDLAKEGSAAQPFKPHQSNIRSLNRRIVEMEKHQDLPSKIMDALRRERRRRATEAQQSASKSVTPPPGVPAAPAAKRQKTM
eukprot:TRINITY_DN21066_c0_g1_i1.p2 TRINITY_DN21066_c0_g1~~TRINITY_DN21066_c0_g1_i1.p2  ORF type:complete len:205 (+),score=73.61 TRINITY_DN21066_c0_g1_i1:61-675(+)